MFPIIVFLEEVPRPVSLHYLNHYYAFIVSHWNAVGMHLRPLMSLLFVLECAFHNRLFRSCHVAAAKKVSGTFSEAVIEIS